METRNRDFFDCRFVSATITKTTNFVVEETTANDHF